MFYIVTGKFYKENMVLIRRKDVLFLICLIVLIEDFRTVDSMTREQIKTSGKIMKKTCMPRNDVTEAQVGNIEQGKFLEERNVMCYIACVYGLGQVVKNNKLSLDAMMKQVDMMFPPEMKQPVKLALEKCKNVAKDYKDICEASYWTAKCIYEANPTNFVFP